MTDGPRLATEAEFPEMMALLDRCFSVERGGMAARYPFVYDPERPDRHAIVVEDGRVVSHVAAIPQTFALESGTVEVWGISGVATDRPHRGNGHMTRLLEFWLDRMGDEDVPLSDLGGDRQRYGHFGYENVGNVYRFRIDERSFRGDPTPSEAVVEYDGAADHLATLRELHGREPYRVVRDREESRTIYGKRGLETLVYEDDDPAYLSMTRGSRSRTVQEFGGSEAGFEALLAHVIAVYDLDPLTVTVPPWHELEPLVARHCSSWSSRPHRKLRIRDFHGLLAAARGQLEERWTERGRTERGSVTLGVTGGESVRVSYEPGSVSIEPADDRADVELERRAMTSLLFGVHDRFEKQRRGDPFLEAALPIRIFVWPTERV